MKKTEKANDEQEGNEGGMKYRENRDPGFGDSPVSSSEDFHPGDVSTKPGIYIFRDRFSKVIYVGKAANLRKRVSSYFQPSRRITADPKLRSLINSIVFYETHPVKNESESLLFESRMIKEYAPRYNVLLRDDKRFPLIKINPSEKFPTLKLARLRKNDGHVYFGPFPKAGALKKTVDFLVRKFGLRTCAPPIPRERDRKHCLAGTVKDCSEPCVGKTSKEEYAERIEALLGVLSGDIGDIVREIRGLMELEVERRRFEKAAEYRDALENLEIIFGKRSRTFRHARIPIDEKAFEGLGELGKVLGLPEPPRSLEAFDISNISGSLAAASMVCFRDGRPDTARYRRFRIRGEGAEPSAEPADYPLGRGGDDCAMMEETVFRRYSRISREIAEKLSGKSEAASGAEDGISVSERCRGAPAACMPDLILIDGGKGQLNAAMKALKRAGTPPTPIIGLAKRNEEIFVPGRQLPIRLDLRNPAVNLLRAVRDEAHRFAVAYHRKLRDARIEESILDQIPGIGAKRKRELLRAFGSVTALRKASKERIAEKAPGIGLELAAEIAKYLRPKQK
ncbi:MAG: excinuclease ABC subunit UvrC [Kiritimatiellaeota bacterium]|nr:excinuclease ABC subunit UvrC [Kiritimatiellota bacterium]